MGLTLLTCGGRTFALMVAFTSLLLSSPTTSSMVINEMCVDGPFLLEGEEFACQMAFEAGEQGTGTLYFTYDSTANTTRFGLVLPATGWISLGFQEDQTALGMIGGQAVVGLPTGLAGYSLTAQNVAGVVSEDSVTSSLSETWYVVDAEAGTVSIAFTVDMTTTPLPIRPQETTYFIWAIGQDTTFPAVHLDRGYGLTATVDASLAEVETYMPVSSETIHGIMMAVSWGVLLPAGAVSGRYISHFGQGFFIAHLILQISGVTLAFGGVSYIVWAKGLPAFWFLDATYSGTESFTHGKVGIWVLFLAAAQILVALFRPHPGTSLLRRTWEIFHLVLGKTALGLATFNIFFGIYIYSLVSLIGSWVPWAIPISLAIFFIYLAQATTDKVLRHRALMELAKQLESKERI